MIKRPENSPEKTAGLLAGGFFDGYSLLNIKKHLFFSLFMRI
jgi:hypothetical protein